MYAQPLILVSILAGIVAGQVNTSGLPTCAGSCVNGFGGCQQLDVQCICSNTKLLKGLACCVSKQCSPDDQQATIDFANALCEGQGVSDLPQTATCASSSASSSSSSGAVVGGSNATSTTFTSGSATITVTHTSPARATATDLAAGSSEGAMATSSSASASASASSTGTGGGAGNKVEGFGLGMIFAGLVAAL